MIPLLFLGLVLYALTPRGWPPGQGPLDDKPEGTLDTAESIRSFTGQSGARYRVSFFAARTAHHFVSAVRASNDDWVTFLVDDTTGARAFYKANAGTPSQLDVLRKDFGV